MKHVYETDIRWLERPHTTTGALIDFPSRRVSEEINGHISRLHSFVNGLLL